MAHCDYIDEHLYYHQILTAVLEIIEYGYSYAEHKRLWFLQSTFNLKQEQQQRSQSGS